jgi:hypothetical protein
LVVLEFELKALYLPLEPLHQKAISKPIYHISHMVFEIINLKIMLQFLSVPHTFPVR